MPPSHQPCFHVTNVSNRLAALVSSVLGLFVQWGPMRTRYELP